MCERVYEATENEALAEAVSWLVNRPLKIIGIMALAWIATRLAKRIVDRIVDGLDPTTPTLGLTVSPETSVRAQARAKTVSTVLGGLATATIYTIAFLTILGEFDISLGPLLAGAGIVGVALGFGAQSMVKDFLAGFFMVVEDQFGVGDVIDVGDVTGTVEKLTLRSTRLRAADGTVWHVPNGVILRVGNQSQRPRSASYSSAVGSSAADPPGADPPDADPLDAEAPDADPAADSSVAGSSAPDPSGAPPPATGPPPGRRGVDRTIQDGPTEERP